MTLADLPHADLKPQTAQEDEATMTARLLLSVLALLLAWAIAVFTWGLPGLYLPALAMVPVIFAALIAIAKG